jgi:Tfp pilus assembly protein PilO
MTKLLLTIIFIVTSLVGGFYVVYPSYTEYKIKVKEAEILYEELENIMVYVAQLKEIERRIAENKKELNKIEGAFPEDHDAPSFFLYLKEKIKEHNLKSEGDMGGFLISDYTVDNTKHARLREISFGLDISGRYEDTKRFFGEIERLIRVINVNSISISGSSSSSGLFSSESPRGKEFVNINFSGSTFSY